MKISLIHPTRRPHAAKQASNKWLSCADNVDNIEYILSIDNDDPEYELYSTLFSDPIIVTAADNKSAIEAVNRAASCSTGDLIVQISDDFDCELHWDTLLINALKDKYDYCVKTKDGIQRTLMTLPVLDRIYYNRFGYIYHEAYTHLWADNELTAVAHMLGRNIELDILFPHNHPITGRVAPDALNHRNNLTLNSGMAIFNERLRNNFGLSPVQIVKPYSMIRWH